MLIVRLKKSLHGNYRAQKWWGQVNWAMEAVTWWCLRLLPAPSSPPPPPPASTACLETPHRHYYLLHPNPLLTGHVAQRLSAVFFCFVCAPHGLCIPFMISGSRGYKWQVGTIKNNTDCLHQMWSEHASVWRINVGKWCAISNIPPVVWFVLYSSLIC